MEQPEVMRRVIAILTEALERRRIGREEPDRDLGSPELMAALLTELMPRIELPPGATAQDVVEAVSHEIPLAIERMAGGFVLAFAVLAEAHDDGEEGSAADVLRDLALVFEGRADEA